MGRRTRGKRKHRVPAARAKPARSAAAERTRLQSVRVGRVSAPRTVPAHIDRPPYARSGVSCAAARGPAAASGDVVEAMRSAGSAARRVLAAVAAEIAPGITTDHLDEVCHEACIAEGGYPSPLGYPGPPAADPARDDTGNFPKSLCTSVNEIICHGIPDDRPLRDGDIVNCDVTIFLGGVHGDHSETFFVGEPDAASRRLVAVTREAMYLGIAAVQHGATVSDIGRAIQDHAESRGYGVVREFVGHGTGRIFHGPPNILHYYDPTSSAARTEMTEGMTFTVEPMIVAPSASADGRIAPWVPRVGKIWDDHWTAPTEDGSRTAQFEHTVLVTTHGAELLTVTDDEPQPFLSADPASRRNPDNWPQQLPTAAVAAC